MNTVNRARIARKRAQRLGLRLSQRGTVFTLCDDNGVTLAVGMLGVVDAYLVARCKPNPPGPPRRNRPPELWRRDVGDYLLTLSAAGQREATIRHRHSILCMAARGRVAEAASLAFGMLSVCCRRKFRLTTTFSGLPSRQSSS
jgi:hypothetical protein